MVDDIAALTDSRLWLSTYIFPCPPLPHFWYCDLFIFQPPSPIPFPLPVQPPNYLLALTLFSRFHIGATLKFCLCLLIFPDLSVCLQCSPVPTAPVMLHSCIFPIVYLAFGFPFHRMGLRDATRIIFIINGQASSLLRDFSGSLTHTGTNPSLSLSTVWP